MTFPACCGTRPTRCCSCPQSALHPFRPAASYWPWTGSRLPSPTRTNALVNGFAESRLHEVYHPAVVAGVLGEAARQQADLLVVVARRHSLLGSLFHRSVTALLIQKSPIPVLILPAAG